MIAWICRRLAEWGEGAPRTLRNWEIDLLLRRKYARKYVGCTLHIGRRVFSFRRRE